MEGFTNTVYDIVSAALSILPNSPFTFLSSYSSSPVGQWLGWVNWFIPVNTFLVIAEAWLICIGTYYIMALVLRWVKAIE